MTDRATQWPKLLTASSAEKFSLCHGAANLPAAIPGWKDGTPKPGNAADLGSAAHELLAFYGTMSPAELKAYVLALSYLHELKLTRRFKVLVEASAPAHWLDEQNPPITTVDLVLYTQDELHILDWKWGQLHVPVKRNKQLMYYAMTFAHLAPKAKGVYLHIVQPKDASWDPEFAAVYVSADELAEFADEMREAHQAITTGDVTLTPGDHCTFCPANPYSRGTKGSPLCPAQSDVLFPDRVLIRQQMIDDGDDDPMF